MSARMEEILRTILARCEAELTERVGRAEISPGRPPWDDCCAGQLALWISGISSNGQRSGCPTTLQVSCTVQIIRCQATLTDRGAAPSARQVTEDGLRQLYDMQEIERALRCRLDDLGLRNLTVTSWQALDTQGACGGGEWTFSFTATSVA